MKDYYFFLIKSNKSISRLDKSMSEVGNGKRWIDGKIQKKSSSTKVERFNWKTIQAEVIIMHRKSVKMTEIDKSRIRNLIKVGYFLSLLKFLNLNSFIKLQPFLSYLWFIKFVVWVDWRLFLGSPSVSLLEWNDLLKSNCTWRV